MSASPPLISLVVAMARNRVIGRDNGLPWRLSADLKRFKATTLGKPILMGRKTFESIGKPLPGRRNIVLTRDRAWHAEGVDAVRSVEQAIELAHGAAELAVIGGAEIYRLMLPIAGRIHLTRVEADVTGDTLFPELDWAQWREVEAGAHPADERNQYPVSFMILDRKAGPRSVSDAP
jgi:dihydrofolate reductase